MVRFVAGFVFSALRTTKIVSHREHRSAHGSLVSRHATGGSLSPKLIGFSRELAQTKPITEQSMKNYIRWPFRLLKARIQHGERR